MSGLHEWVQSLGPAFYEYRGYYWLPAAAMAWVATDYLVSSEVAVRRLGRSASRRVRRVLLGVLAALALLSIGAYNNFFNYHYGGYLNAYEFFHYYMGSKYAREVGYFNMYGAALVADQESGRLYRPPDNAIRDLRSHEYHHLDSILDHPDRYRSLFSDSRWREWVEDVAYFKGRLGPSAWNRILRDRGYNATPVWTTLVGGVMSNRVSTRHEVGMTFLALLDPLLLGAAVVFVGWVFGARSALLVVVFVTSSYLMAHVHMKGAFLRTDFAVALILAACQLKRGRYLTAGALAGYASMSRIFPVVFLFGIASKLVWELLAPSREGAFRYGRFFAGFAASLIVLFASSVVYFGGTTAWSDFAEKIRVHRASYHVWNVGLASLIAAEIEESDPEAPGAVRASRSGVRAVLGNEGEAGRGGLLRSIQFLLLLGCFVVIRGLDDHDALVFGFVPVFVVVAPTYYYYILLVLPFLFLVRRLDRPSGLAGVLYMFAFGMAGFWLYDRWDQYFTTYFGNSVLALVLVLYMMGVALLETRRAAVRSLS